VRHDIISGDLPSYPQRLNQEFFQRATSQPFFADSFSLDGMLGVRWAGVCAGAGTFPAASGSHSS